MARGKIMARMCEDVLVTTGGGLMAIEKGRCGEVLRETKKGTITVLRVDGTVISLPTSILEIVSPETDKDGGTPNERQVNRSRS